MRRRCRLALCLVSLMALASAQAWNQSLLGVAVSEPADGYEPGGRQRNLQRLVALGQSFFTFSFYWKNAEPQPGQYDFNDLDAALREAAQFHLPVLVTTQTIDTNQKAFPADLLRKKLDDPEVISRYKRLVRNLAPHFKGRVPWFMVGNEVDVYFAVHPDELEAFNRFYKAAYQEIRRSAPEVQAGLVFTYSGALENTEPFKTLAARGDINCLTYYPLRPDFTFEDPSVAERDIAKIVAAMRGKKFIFSEIGYASAESLSSSEAKQAEFYRNVFRALEKHQEQIIATMFFLQFDFSRKTCEELGSYYQVARANFKDFLCSLGLFDQNHRPKEAWTVFQEGMRRLARR